MTAKVLNTTKRAGLVVLALLLVGSLAGCLSTATTTTTDHIGHVDTETTEGEVAESTEESVDYSDMAALFNLGSLDSAQPTGNVTSMTGEAAGVKIDTSNEVLNHANNVSIMQARQQGTYATDKDGGTTPPDAAADTDKIAGGSSMRDIAAMFLGALSDSPSRNVTSLTGEAAGVKIETDVGVKNYANNTSIMQTQSPGTNASD